MFTGNDRICDICGSSIPKGIHYRVAHMIPEAASLLLDIEDPGLMPTWVQNPDGTVRLDICQGCTVSMGSPDAKRAN